MQMMLVLHGVAGGWDEFVIVVLAFAVLWIAVKLAGRKPAGEDADVTEDELAVDVESTEEHKRPPAPPAATLTKSGP
jgi:hypothetical protein